jgi:GNAT superfamily N-acetyltransferase
MGQLPLTLRPGTERDHSTIIGLIDGAAEWLRTKNTDQWAQPWPSAEDRNYRILRDLRLNRTLIGWDGEIPVATITTARHNSIWPAEMQHERAVYAGRLVVARAYGGRGIGAALLDWIGTHARESQQARWIRVDVWTTNHCLHAYYRAQGFQMWGLSEQAPHYPAAALFQKPTDHIKPDSDTVFRLVR